MNKSSYISHFQQLNDNSSFLSVPVSFRNVNVCCLSRNPDAAFHFIQLQLLLAIEQPLFSHIFSALFLCLTGAGKPVKNQFFLYIPVNEGHHLGYIGLNVCFNKRVTALVWAAERELLGFWCHVCLHVRICGSLHAC